MAMSPTTVPIAGTPAEARRLGFAADGAECFPDAARPLLDELLRLVSDIAADRPGVRLAERPPLAAKLAAGGPIGAIAARLAGGAVHPVRAVLFDKTPNANWALGWHQDRTICVRQRIDVPGFGPWTIKGGMLHVEPPFALLARMITLRIHLDDVPATNAPLLIAPGSHRLGRIEIGQIASVVERSGTAACLAGAGDIWAYSTPIVHASDRAAEPMRRRVLQVDYSPDPLPGGLVWQGI